MDKFTVKDLEYLRAFRNVVFDGKFEVEGRALTKVGALLQWFNTLDKKMENSIKASNETVRRDLKEGEDNGSV